MTDALFVLGVAVALLGVPGAWQWVSSAPLRSLNFMSGCSEPQSPAFDRNSWPGDVSRGRDV